MKEKLINWLNRQYPIIASPKQGLISSIYFGVFIFIFLYAFQPFGFHEVVGNKLAYFAGFGVITFIGVSFVLIILPMIFKNFFSTDNWYMWKNILFSALIFLIISILNWAYNSTIGYNIAPQRDLSTFIIETLLVGTIPSVILSDIIERKFWNKKYNSKLSEENEDNTEYSQQVISFNTDNKSEMLEVTPDDLLCISSTGNYSDFYLIENERVKKKTLRITMKKTEENLEQFNSFFRCHRSYIVNMKRVKDVEGNSRSCNLKLKDLDFDVPVSRSLQKSIVEKANKYIN